MRHIVLGSSAILLLALVCPDQSSGQGKKGKKKGAGAETALAQDYAQLAAVKELRGRLTSGVGANSLSLDVDINRMEPNPKFKGGGVARPGGGGGNNLNLLRQMQNLQNQQAQLARIRDPRQRQQRMNQLRQQMARLQQQIQRESMKQFQQKMGNKGGGGQNGPFRMVTTTKEFQLELAENVVVRWYQPPTEYDDKGFLKKYTREELAKMKGKDASLPGYEAKTDDLQPGQIVHLYLKAPAKTSAKKKVDLIGGEDDLLAGDGSRPSIRMIVILQESPGPTFAPAKGKKKKN